MSGRVSMAESTRDGCYLPRAGRIGQAFSSVLTACRTVSHDFYWLAKAIENTRAAGRCDGKG